MERARHFDSIEKRLNWLSCRVVCRGRLNLTELNIWSEYLFCKLLNVIWDVDLSKITIDGVNTPAIDLGDSERGIAIQVTSNNKLKKIEETVKKFVKRKLHKTYPKLRIVRIGHSRKHRKKVVQSHPFELNIQDDVFDLSDLLEIIQNFELAELEQLDELLTKEIPCPDDVPVSLAPDSLSDWGKAVATSSLWGVAEGDDESFKSITTQIVEGCWSRRVWLREKIGSDPWLDDDFSVRVIKTLECLDGEFLGQAPLSQPERALLVCAPFLHETISDTVCEEVFNQDDRDAAWSSSQFRPLDVLRNKYPHIVRKAERLRTTSMEDSELITMWMLHRSILTSSEAWTIAPAELERIMGDRDLANRNLSSTFTSGRLCKIARCVSGAIRRLAANGASGEPDYVREDVLRSNNGKRVVIREQLLGSLLRVASFAALNTIELDSVIVDHIGLSESLSVDPNGLVETLQTSTVDVRDMQLHIEVPSPPAALEKAVQLQIENLNDAIRFIERSEILTTAEIAQFTKKAISNNTRHLPSLSVSQRDVREILIGERLYKDPTLAFRELYQNALDACRYRQARLTYSDRKSGTSYLNKWEGKIEIEQYVDDDGRHIVRCLDNGIGMNRDMVDSCFAIAGKRFVHTDEFLDEHSLWRQLDEAIEFYPNSQFGIGVFSYFMLADELHVQTRPVLRNGKPEAFYLDIRISGTGSLFQIEKKFDSDVLEEGGSEVCLFLGRTDFEDTDGGVHEIDCFKTLSQLLWHAEYQTIVSSGENKKTWAPSLLSPPDANTQFLETSTDCVWWLSEQKGVVLSDGIFTERTESFAIVNLANQFRPALSTDRRTITKFDRAHYNSMLLESIDSLGSAPYWLDFRWMWAFSHAHPVLGKHLYEVLVQNDCSLPIMHEVNEPSISVVLVGCRSIDTSIVMGANKVPPALRNWQFTPNLRSLAIRKMLWQFARNQGTDEFLGECKAKEVAAQIPQYFCFDNTLKQLTCSDTSRQHHHISGLTSVKEIVARCDKLGLSIEQAFEKLSEYSCLFDFAKLPGTLESLKSLALPREQACELLSKYSCLFDLARLPVTLDVLKKCSDREFALVEHVGTGNHKYNAFQIFQICVALDETPAWVHGSLTKLFAGTELRVPIATEAHLAKMDWTESDRKMLTDDLSGDSNWIRGKLSPERIFYIAEGLKLKQDEVLERLSRYSDYAAIKLPDTALKQKPDSPDKNDLVVLSPAFDSNSVWRCCGELPVQHLVAAAKAINESAGETWDRLARFAEYLDFELPERAKIESLRYDAADLAWLSAKFDGKHPWVSKITVGHVVSASKHFKCSFSESCARIVELVNAYQLDVDDCDLEAAKTLSIEDVNPWPNYWTFAIARNFRAVVLNIAKSLNATPLETFKRLQRCQQVFGFELAGVDIEALARLDTKSGEFDGLHHLQSIHGTDVLDAALRWDISPCSAYDRLREYAAAFKLELTCYSLDFSPERLDSRDCVAISCEPDIQSSFLPQSGGSWIKSWSLMHLFNAGRTLGEPVSRVYDRLKRHEGLLNFKVPIWDPQMLDVLNDTDEADRIVLSQRLDGVYDAMAHSVDPEGPVHTIDDEHVQLASWMIGESRAQILQRLKKFEQFGIDLVQVVFEGTS